MIAQKGLWNLVREKNLRERGALPKEEGDAHTIAKFELFLWRGAGALRGGRSDVECEKKNDHCKNKKNLEESCSMKVEVEELEDEKGCPIFETFNTDGPSKFVVVRRSR